MPLVSRVLTVNTKGNVYAWLLWFVCPLFAKILYSQMDYSRGQLSQLQELGICPREHFILVNFILRTSSSSPKSSQMGRWSGSSLIQPLSFSAVVVLWWVFGLIWTESDWQREIEAFVSKWHLTGRREHTVPQCLTQDYFKVSFSLMSSVKLK